MPIFDSLVSKCIELPDLVTPTREISPWHDQSLDLSPGVATIGQRCKRGQRATSATSNFQDQTPPKTERSMFPKGADFRKQLFWFSVPSSHQHGIAEIHQLEMGNTSLLPYFFQACKSGIPNCSRWQQEETGTAKDRSQ